MPPGRALEPALGNQWIGHGAACRRGHGRHDDSPLRLFVELLAFSPAMHILLLVAFVLAVLAMAAVSVHVLAQAGGRLPMVSTQGWIDIGSSAGAAAGCGVALGLRYNQVTGAL